MENEPVCITNILGTKRWYLGYKLHRLDGPAIEYTDGYKEWRYHHKRHRLDGPAIIWGDEHKEWWISGHPVTDIITNWAKENDIDLEYLSEDDKLLIKLTWANYGK